jgi:hypothetical protein
MKKSIYAIMIAVCFMQVSCSKKDQQPEQKPDPIEVTDTAKKLQKDVQGKWTFINAAFPKTSSAFEGKTIITSPTLKSMARLSAIANTSDVAPKTGFIEFLNDNTYIIYDAKGNYFTGKFEAKDGQTIDLSGFGTIKEIKFTEGKIDFKITYNSSNQTISISANKAIAMTLNERTKLLCQTWEFVSIEENGKDIRVNGKWEVFGGLDGNGHDIIVYADKVYVTFSLSGTYFVHSYDKTKLMSGQVYNWKFHPTNQNKFLDYDNDFNLASVTEEDYVTITELTKDALKIEEVYSYDNKVETTKMVLRPVQ